MCLGEVFCKSFDCLLLLFVCYFSLFIFLLFPEIEKKPKTKIKTKTNLLLVQTYVEMQIEKKYSVAT